MNKEVEEKYKIQSGLPEKFFCSVSRKEITLDELSIELADQCFERNAPWLKLRPIKKTTENK